MLTSLLKSKNCSLSLIVSFEFLFFVMLDCDFRFLKAFVNVISTTPSELHRFFTDASGFHHKNGSEVCRINVIMLKLIVLFGQLLF